MRVLVEVLPVLLVLLLIAYVAYRLMSVRPELGRRRPELDVSTAPSSWYTDSRTTEDGHTEVCIVRVETQTGVIRERRVLTRLANTAPGYSDALDKAMDDAYAAMRVANVNLRRR